MQVKPVTVILRLWRRSRNLVAEIRFIDRQERHYIRGGRDLLAFLEKVSGGELPEASTGDDEDGVDS